MWPPRFSRGGGGAEVAKQIYSACAQPACELLLHTGEENIIQSACELFRKLLLVGGERLLTWAPGGPSQALHMLVLARPSHVPCCAVLCLSCNPARPLLRCQPAFAGSLSHKERRRLGMRA